MPDNDQQKIRFSMPVELRIRAVSDNTLLAKIKYPALPYSITEKQLSALQTRAQQAHSSFEDILFNEVKTSFINSETTKSLFDQYKWKYPEVKQITIDLKLKGKIIKDTDTKIKGDNTASMQVKQLKLYPTSKKVVLLRYIYVILLTAFILAMIGIYYAAFRK
jgi:hypothetical protein